MAELKLKTPIEIDGKMKDVIEYDLEPLTGDNIEHAIAELGKQGIVVAMVETDQRYHAMLFALSAGIDYTDVKRMGIKDFMKATNAVRDFFLEE